MFAVNINNGSLRAADFTQMSIERIREFVYATRAIVDKSRAVEYCLASGNPFGFTKCEFLAPSANARWFIRSANASTLPALSRARQRATSFGLFTSNARSRSIR